MGLLTARDLMLFFGFWELSLLPIYLLTLQEARGPRRFAATRMLMTMIAGGIPFFYALILIGMQPAALPFDMDGFAALAAALTPGERQILLALLIVGIGVKVPIIGMHTWLVGMMMEGPLAAAIWLIGLKTSGYAIFRVILPICGDAPDFGRALATLGVIGLLSGALLALVQTNLRRLAAFLAIAHAGVLLVAAASRDPAAIRAAWALLIDAGLAMPALLLAAGMLHARTGSTDLASLGGIASRAPRLAALLLLSALAVAGMPGSLAFPLEIILVAGVSDRLPGHAVLLAIGLSLCVAAIVRALTPALSGPPATAEIAAMEDLSVAETAALLGLLALCGIGGIWPGLVLR